MVGGDADDRICARENDQASVDKGDQLRGTERGRPGADVGTDPHELGVVPSARLGREFSRFVSDGDGFARGSDDLQTRFDRGFAAPARFGQVILQRLFDRLGKGADGRFSVCRVRIHRLRQLGRDPGHRIGIIGQVKAVRGGNQTVEPGIIVKRPGVCCRVVDNAERLVGVAKKDAIVGSLRVAQDC